MNLGRDNNYEHFQAEVVPSGGESMQPSDPFLYVNPGDIKRSEHLSAESTKSSLQPISYSPEMTTVARDAKYTHDSPPLEGVQSLNLFLNSSDINHLGPDDDLMASRENPIGSSSDALSSATTQKYAETYRDLEPLDGRQINNLNQVTPESISEAKTPENSLQNVREENNCVDKSASPSTRLEHQPQQDLVTLHGETTWSQSTLAFPPNYAVGKPNESKIPRPQNPLIHVVVAHDKSKAFAGSDEDDDSDSWSDS